jgi:hypothetical protein
MRPNSVICVLVGVHGWFLSRARGHDTPSLRVVWRLLDEGGPPTLSMAEPWQWEHTEFRETDSRNSCGLKLLC